jgi:hypothetical protein
VGRDDFGNNFVDDIVEGDGMKVTLLLILSFFGN